MTRPIPLFSIVVSALFLISPGKLAVAGDGGHDTHAVAPPRLVFPQIGNGGGFKTNLILQNTGANFDAGVTGHPEPASVRIEFFNSAGEPLDLDLGGIGMGSTFDIQLSRGEVFSAETSGGGDIQVGYALVFGPPGVDGTAVFTLAAVRNGTNLFEAGVPATRPRRSFSVYVDSRGDRRTGLALVNPRPYNGETTAHATMRFYTTDFQLLAQRELELAPGAHLPEYVDQLFAEAAGREGSLTVSSDKDIAAVTLRQNLASEPAPTTLTAFPVIPERAEDLGTGLDPVQHVFYFPQIGDGRNSDTRFQTTLILVNTGTDTNAHVEFFDSQGAPLAIGLGDLGVGSVFDVPLSRGACFSAQTPGVSDLAVGYARVTSSARVGGTAVFTRSTRDGVILYESGVAAVTPLNSFTLLSDGLGFRDTGFALVNPSRGDANAGQSVTLGLRLYNHQFQGIATTFLSLPARHHQAVFLSQVFPDRMAELDSQLGSVTVESFLTGFNIPSPVAALTLRQTDDPGIGFPDEIPTLTTFPVIVGRADGPSNTDLSITTAGPATPIPGGDAFTYFLSVSNLGPDLAQGVNVTDTLPPGAQFLNASGDHWTCQNVSNTVTCSRTLLGVDSPSLIRVDVLAPAQPQLVVNTGRVTSISPDPNPDNNFSSVATSILAP